jgi:hypothetical protein
MFPSGFAFGFPTALVIDLMAVYGFVTMREAPGATSVIIDDDTGDKDT